VGERIRAVLNRQWAAATSVLLVLPILFLFTIDLFDYEPRFVQQFFNLLYTPDDQPNTFGRIFSLYLILSAPVSFVINLVPMLKRPGSGQTAPFSATRVHTVIGLSILVAVLIICSRVVLEQLGAIASPLGPASVLVQSLCLLVFLPVPALFLLGRLPRVTRARSDGALMIQPTSINLMVGAALLLVVLMEISAVILETTACSVELSC
jgi:hypothetical protein